MSPRPATPADTEALRVMMVASNGYQTPAGRKMIKAFADGWSVPDADHEVWLLEGQGGVPAGFYQLIRRGQEQELDLFFTDNVSQGSGVGRKLFTHMRERARELGARRLVIASNPNAAPFYRRMGALDDGVAPPVAGINWERPRLVVRTDIRQAVAADAAQIAVIHRLAFRTAMPWMEELHTPEEDLVYFRDEVLPNAEVWVSLARDGGLSGFLAMHPGWIDHLYVHPAHQHRGAGSALMDFAKSRGDALQLWAFQRNTYARAFYEGRGFTVVRLTDGSGNEENEPDVLYAWSRVTA